MQIQTHNHLVCKQTLNHLAKLATLAVVKYLFENKVVVGLSLISLLSLNEHCEFESENKIQIYIIPTKKVCLGTFYETKSELQVSILKCTDLCRVFFLDLC